MTPLLDRHVIIYKFCVFREEVDILALLMRKNYIKVGWIGP
jgi:hypothetical protein